MKDQEIIDFINEKYKDLPDGLYNIGSRDLFAHTGKGGFIDYKIKEFLQLSIEWKIKDLEQLNKVFDFIEAFDKAISSI